MQLLVTLASTHSNGKNKQTALFIVRLMQKKKKEKKNICEQWRPWSDCADAQSDQGRHFSLTELFSFLYISEEHVLTARTRPARSGIQLITARCIIAQSFIIIRPSSQYDLKVLKAVQNTKSSSSAWACTGKSIFFIYLFYYYSYFFNF